jgi:hypothetical protein
VRVRTRTAIFRNDGGDPYPAHAEIDVPDTTAADWLTRGLADLVEEKAPEAVKPKAPSASHARPHHAPPPKPKGKR